MDARVRRFALVGGALLLVFLCLYPYALPAYRALVLSSSDALLGLARPAIRLDLQADGGWQVSVPAFQDRPKWVFIMDFQELGQGVVFLGIAILPALVLATPASLATRLRLLGVSLVCLLAIHALSVSVVIFIIARYCYGRESEAAAIEAGRTCRLIIGSFPPWSHIATFGLWGALTWRHWFGRPGELRGARGDRRRG